MTKLKCAICGHKLACDEPKDDKLAEVLYCPTCKHFMLGNYRMWQELIRTRKALDVAVDALKKIKEECYDTTDVLLCANIALGQITALEQKD